MKKVILLLCAAILGITAANAQSLQETLKGSPELTKLFVYPFGISKPVADITSAEMSLQLDSLKVEYKTMDLGVFGQSFQVNTPDLKVGGVPVAMAGLTVGQNLCVVVYTSEASANCQDFADTLTKELSKFSKIDPGSIQMPMPSPDGVEMYSVGSNSGIGVGIVPNGNQAIAIMSYVKDATGIANMFGTPQQ